MSYGKTEFYSKAKEALIEKGYTYYDGDTELKGKGRQHSSKPDFIAYKNKCLLIGEIKSQRESPRSSSWRQPQPSDGNRFVKVRLEIAKKEAEGKLDASVGGHEIIIRGQIQDYCAKLGRTYELPDGVRDYDFILGAYTFPVEQIKNVVQAIRNSKCVISEAIDNGNGSVTYIYELEMGGKMGINEKPSKSEKLGIDDPLIRKILSKLGVKDPEKATGQDYKILLDAYLRDKSLNYQMFCSCMDSLSSSYSSLVDGLKLFSSDSRIVTQSVLDIIKKIIDILERELMRTDISKEERMDLRAEIYRYMLVAREEADKQRELSKNLAWSILGIFLIIAGIVVYIISGGKNKEVIVQGIKTIKRAV